MNNINSYVCLHCGNEVSDSPVGTTQRNHCPYCLWSLHLDNKLPGDRNSNCHGLMKPIGLTTKIPPDKKLALHHTQNEIGEIMIVHQCEKCGIYSKNRIAGDDKPDSILKLLYVNTKHTSWIILNEVSRKEVERQLYGLPLSKADL